MNRILAFRSITFHRIPIRYGNSIIKPFTSCLTTCSAQIYRSFTSQFRSDMMNNEYPTNITMTESVERASINSTKVIGTSLFSQILKLTNDNSKNPGKIPTLNTKLKEYVSSNELMNRAQYEKLLSVLAENHLGYHAYSLLLKLQKNHDTIVPSLYRYTLSVCCYNSLCLHDALEIISMMKKNDIQLTRCDYEGLITLYIRNDKMNDALSLLQKMKSECILPSIWTYNILLGGLKDRGDMITSLKLFQEIQERHLIPDDVTCNTLIRTFGKTNNTNCIPPFLSQMKENGINCNVGTYSSLTWVYGREGNIEQCNYYLNELMNDKLYPNIDIMNNIMKAYSIQRDINGVLKVVNDIHSKGLEPNITTYTNIALTYISHNNYIKCFESIETAIQKNITHNYVSKGYFLNLKGYTVPFAILALHSYLFSLAKERSYNRRVPHTLTIDVGKGTNYNRKTINESVKTYLKSLSPPISFSISKSTLFLDSQSFLRWINSTSLRCIASYSTNSTFIPYLPSSVKYELLQIQKE
ncbi:hypothetical protein WA158_007832 [Blastocystis sp. Blastoise]